MFIKDVYSKINRKILYNFEKQRASVKEQKAFLDSLPDPKDDIDLAYLHYITLNYYAYEKWMLLLFNLAAVFLLPYLRFRNRKTGELPTEEKSGIVHAESNIKTGDILPPDFETRYGDFRVVKLTQKRGMDPAAKRIFRECVKKKRFHPYFLLILFQKLADNSSLIREHHPKAIAVFAKERDFSAPIVSRYCESLGIEYVSFMHGDYTYSIDKAFQRFTRYYVWDEHYIGMFKDLKWAMDSFEVYLPEKLRGIVSPHPDGEYDFYITYYFGAESEKRIQGVRRAFGILRDAGYRCRIRPHPRFSDIEHLKAVFEGFSVEDPGTITLTESLDSTRYAAALNSTVLSQTYYSGKEYVIDDYSDPERYASLEERQYIMLYKPHKLLSELVREAEDQ